MSIEIKILNPHNIMSTSFTSLHIHATSEASGAAAAVHTAAKINAVLVASPDAVARVIIATGASQFHFLAALINEPVAWDRVEFFHLDEYFDLEITHDASFRKYLVERFFDKISPSARAVNLLDPADLAGYEAKLRAAPIDLACIGIGENGHIAFNDPGAPFEEEAWVNKRALDVPCRMQQVGEGWFADLDACPTHAASLSIPAIMACKSISCVVPDERKREAVGKSIRDAVDTACPATILRTHADCALWLDQNSSPFA